MLGLKKNEIPVLTTREGGNKVCRANLYFHPIIRELKWTPSDEQSKTTCPHLSLIGNVNALLPFPGHVHRTTITSYGVHIQHAFPLTMYSRTPILLGLRLRFRAVMR